MNNRVLVAAMILCLLGLSTLADAQVARGRIRGQRQNKVVEQVQLAGLNVAVWKPSQPGPARLIVFSHGYHGCNTQSTFLMTSLANAGYVVVAPNHKDAICAGGLRQRPEELKGVTAVLALSPYCEPFLRHGKLAAIGIPVMFQGGTRDVGVTPSVKKSDGCYSATSSPAYFVELNGAGHFAWTDLNSNYQGLINHYSIAFFDRHLRNRPTENHRRRRPAFATCDLNDHLCRTAIC